MAHLKRMSKQWTAEDLPYLRGKRFIITGANTGIGYHAALKLARREAELVLACRDRKRGEAALAKLHDEAPSAHVELEVLDLASLDSVRQFAEKELARKQPLYALINNAGVMAVPKRMETADGFEMQFGTNVLGHFALTGLLLPALERGATQDDPSRVVTIASIAHKRTNLRLDDLQSKRSYSPMQAYQQSKLGDLMFSLELSRRLQAKGVPMKSIAAHPGVAATELFRGDGRSAAFKTVRTIVGHAISIVLNTDAEGALPTLFAATSPDAENGGYYGPQGYEEMRGEKVGVAKVAPQARDAAAAAKLWELCEQWTGVRFL
ncbi:MAG: oxidoreductase [Edaphobacter sp.]|uniref:oxidoreductase n=1 Tax=Edaphobacter sp. TaxID=1934404 RepID=UPI002388F8DE|nr:oxidoreductase [Edaphobacter sp.]MDE1178009.1 oxidoreductase [Edaphobacter sp.]